MSLPARFAPLARFGILLPALVWLLALALSAWLAARWYWRIAGPRTEYSHHAARTDPLAVGRDVAAAHLFGASLRPEADGQTAAPAPGRFSLIGVAANSGKSRGFAILQETGQAAISVIEGEDVQPGLKLTRVLPQSVELSRDGVRETLRLSDASGSAVPAVPIAGASMGNAGAASTGTMPAVQVSNPPPSTITPPPAVASAPQAASAAAATPRAPSIRPTSEE